MTVRGFSRGEEEVLALRPSGWTKAAIRLAVGVGVIAFLLWQSDVSAIQDALANSNQVLIIAAYLLNIGLLIVSAFRWRVFLEALEIKLGIATVLRLTFVGSFFNAFLPTGVGGDAYKALRIRAANTTLATSFATVLLDRLAGIASLAAIGILASLIAIIRSETTPLVYTGLAVAIVVLVLTTVLLLLGQSLLGGGRSTWFGIRPRLRRTLDAAARAIRTPSTVRQAFGLGLVGQAFGIAGYVSLAWSLDLGISLGVVALGLLNATVAAAIPVTVNGLGIREAVWVWSLGLYGSGRDEALAYALLVLGVTLATSALGGLIYAVAGGDVDERRHRDTPLDSADL